MRLLVVSSRDPRVVPMSVCMSNASRRFCNLLVVALLLSSCATSGSNGVGDVLPPATDADPVGTASGPVDSVPDEVDSVPAPSAEGFSGEEVLLVRQIDGETLRMFTIRADGSGEQEFRLPAPCAPDDRGCAIRMVMPSVNGRSLIVALEHLYWYDVPTGDLTHITQFDDVWAEKLGESRFAVATTSTDAGPMLLVVDREAGTTFETPFDASIQIVAELPDGVLVRDQRGPTVIVNVTSGSVATIDDSLLVGPDHISADGELIAAFDLGGDERQLVMIDVDDPSSPSPWPPIELDFAFDWAGEQLLAVSVEDGVLQLIDESGAVELERLWPGAFRSASVVVDPAGAYALVKVDDPEGVLWYRVDIGAGRADEVVELRGMESADIYVHADKGLVWVTDEVDDDRRYTRLAAAPIAPGPIVEVSSTELPASAAVWRLGDDHVFVRSFPNPSAPDTRWVVDLNSAERAAVAVGTEPRLSTNRSTVAVTARLESGSWVVLMPLEDPAAAVPLVAGTAIDWIER